MFKPIYRITPFLISCLEKIAAQKVLIDRTLKKAPTRIKVARDSFNRSVHSSTWIEGNVLSLAQVKALAAHRSVTAEKDQKLEVENCIQSLKWVLKNKNSMLNQERLLKLHEKMTQGLLPDSRSGRYRQVQNFIVNAKNQVIFTPRPPSKVEQGMKDLFLWLGRNHREHAMIRSAVFHHEFVAIHPFVDGNGRMARAASQWILLHEGYDSLWTLGLDEYFARDRAKYYDMIQQTHDMDGDYTYWIEYVAIGLLEAIQTANKRLQEESRQLAPVSLTPKQKELLDLFKKYKILGSARICKEMKINRARVNQLITPMIKAGIVNKEGKTRAALYRYPFLVKSAS